MVTPTVYYNVASLQDYTDAYLLKRLKRTSKLLSSLAKKGQDVSHDQDIVSKAIQGKFRTCYPKFIKLETPKLIPKPIPKPKRESSQAKLKRENDEFMKTLGLRMLTYTCPAFIPVDRPINEQIAQYLHDNVSNMCSAFCSEYVNRSDIIKGMLQHSGINHYRMQTKTTRVEIGCVYDLTDLFWEPIPKPIVDEVDKNPSTQCLPSEPIIPGLKCPNAIKDVKMEDLTSITLISDKMDWPIPTERSLVYTQSANPPTLVICPPRGHPIAVKAVVSDITGYDWRFEAHVIDFKYMGLDLVHCLNGLHYYHSLVTEPLQVQCYYEYGGPCDVTVI